MLFGIRASWKRRNNTDNEKISGFQGGKGGELSRQRAEEFKAVKIFCITLK